MTRPTVSPDPNKNWKNNAIQFPRLIAELEATGGFRGRLEDLARAMDLDVSDVADLVARAQRAWDAIKERT
jgi:hypothetical protein